MNIQSFDPVIYPFKLWICIANDFSDIESAFYNYDGTEISNLKDDVSNCEAFTIKVMDKQYNSYGALIVFRSKKRMSYEIIAHECSHAAKYLCDHCGIEIDTHEPFEYVIGWMAKCCGKVKNGVK
jgi:hypothetical protein|nr:MAG TPA: protein of unknown function (DUF4157) [Caudoviricetes sp.]